MCLLGKRSRQRHHLGFRLNREAHGYHTYYVQLTQKRAHSGYRHRSLHHKKLSISQFVNWPGAPHQDNNRVQPAFLRPQRAKKAGNQTQSCLYPPASNRRSSGVLWLAPKHREGLTDVPTGARPSHGCQHLCGHIHRCLGSTVKPLCSIPSSTRCFSPPNASTPSMHTKLFTSCCLW